MKFRFIILLFCVVGSLQLTAQNTFSKTYWTGYGSTSLSLSTHSNSHYVSSIERCFENSSNRCLNIMKIDSLGNVLWNFEYGDSTLNFEMIVKDIEIDDEESIYFCGSKNNYFIVSPDTSLLATDIFVGKLNKEGGLTWLNFYDLGSNTDLPNDLEITDQGIILTGKIGDYSPTYIGRDYSAFLFEITEDGDSLWHKKYQHPDGLFTAGIEIEVDHDKGIIVNANVHVRVNTSLDNNSYLFKVDSIGNLVWDTDMIVPEWAWSYDCKVATTIPTLDNGYIERLCGSENSHIAEKVTKYSHDFQEEWSLVFYEDYQYTMYEIQQSWDSSYVLMARFPDFDLNGPLNDVFNSQYDSNCFMKVSKDGELEWTRCYSIYREDTDWLFDMELTENGEIVASGVTTENDTAKVWVLKLDENACFDPDQCEDIHVFNHPENGFVYLTVAEFHDFLDGLISIERPNSINLKISPNPASNEFTIFFGQLSPEKKYKIRISNSFDHQIFKQDLENGIEELIIESFDWNPGLYFVQLIEEGQLVGSKKVVVAK